MSLAHDSELERLAARRWRVAVTLTAIMMTAYFGFILLIAFDKPLMGKLVLGGSVSVGVILGALVIGLAPILTGIYVRWTNQHYDHAIGTLNERPVQPSAPAPAIPPVGTFARPRTPAPVAAGTDPAAPAASSTKPRSEVRQ